MQGFKDLGFSARTDSPTLSQLASHTLLMIGVSMGFRLGGADVSNAFLNGSPLDRELYVRLPRDLAVPGQRPLALRRATKGIYGLREAPRQWWSRLLQEMMTLKFKPCRLDTTLFTYRNPKGQLCALVGTHVDDFLIMANDEGWKQIKRLAQSSSRMVGRTTTDQR